MKAPNIVSEYLVSTFYVLPKNHGNNNAGNSGLDTPNVQMC